MLLLHGAGEKGQNLNLVKLHSWTQVYNDPELYKWLLQQKRMPPKRPEGKRK